MMIITCTRRLQFCAGHRVYGHENKCAHLHGHNYVAWITAQAEALDAVGRVIDFSVLKQQIGTWIEDHWDHGFLYWGEADKEVGKILTDMKTKAYAMPYNPTAENMAHYLLTHVAPLALTGLGVCAVKVVVQETENCSAEACL